MSDEMILENFPFESDEAEDWESDEFFAESDEAAEDIGERARRNRDRSRRRKVRGVRGLAVRGPNGVPAKLATAAETNRGLAGQEMARRSLEGRLDRIESGVRGQHRNDSSVAGIVTLLLGGGLSVWGAVAASKAASGFTFGDWAKQTPSQAAALASVSQVATTGAKLAIHRRYPRAGLGMAADIFSVGVLAAFAFGSWYKPSEPTIEDTREALQAKLPIPNGVSGTLFLTRDHGKTFELYVDPSDKKNQALREVRC